MNQVAEIFAPGEFLKDELEARSWSQTEFAEIIGRPVRLINEIVLGKRSITPETAIQLGDGLGTGPELWMNLESQYQLSKVRSADNFIRRKASLHAQFPVREMIKRGWIESSDSVDILEKQVFDYFEVKSVDENPSLSHAARKSSYADVSMHQMAWLFRTKHIASSQVVQNYSKRLLRASISDLRALLSAPEECRHVSKILTASGVRFVIVEALPGSKIDGACFWLTRSKPVIALSLRLDRIDNFWFVLRHEIEHVLREDERSGTPLIDEDLVGIEDDGSTPAHERAANEAASDFCVPRSELDSYIARVDPYCFSSNRVLGFSARLEIHPGIVVGQLQNRFQEYKYLRRHLVKVRNILTESAPSDGWGHIYSA